MKLRVRGSSIRLRLTRPEVTAIGRGARIEEVVPFAPGKRLVYALEQGGDVVSASLDGAVVTVRIPAAIAVAWSTSEQVGIEAVQPVPPDDALRILIEKDYACLTVREGEDDTDAYPNPNPHC